ncbi:dihydroneopterin aldolase [Phreatobacter sp. AB_2022a]|uniref:dihydroneopterin aldolase n=1 Tax=Phreatobacter sp. AB_2022a TaxID=3003134 RepID=UPI0022870C4E|nr:dihydroneopterin aldolase [Phreatobacter sp. AB_2022a]MCZ0733767.1 dihydroneopterin aldolase [Phreatobacter sp. AB_2022a]
MTDQIFIKGLVIHAHHGVMEHESEVGQRFVIDLDLTCDLAAAAASDHLADTVSYAAIAAETERAFTTRSFKLLEAAAGAVAEAVLAAFPKIRTVRVTVHKPHAPIAAIFDDVGVVLTRGRHD